ncbi:MAG: PAS domain S-box protein [Vulcanimicrobiota bacterium]
MQTVTQLKKLEEELKIEKLKNQIISEITRSIIYLSDVNGKITYMSTEGRILGYDYSQIKGRSILEIVHPGDRDYVEERIGKSYRGETVEPFVFRIVKSDGQEIHVESSGKAFISPNGGFYHYIGVIRDITATKRMEEKLMASEAKYRSIVESMHDVVYTYDTDGMVRYISPSCCVHGYTVADCIGKPVIDFFYPDDHHLLFEAAVRAKDSELFTMILRLVTKDGKVRYTEVTGKASHFYENIAFFTGVIHDIHDKKIAEDELEKTHRELMQSYELLEKRVEERTHELAEANRLLNDEIQERIKLAELLGRKNRELEDFTSVVSHDLKNHLYALMNIQKNAADAPNNLMQRREQLADLTGKLIQFIDNLLKLAKAGKAISGKKQVALGPMIKEIFHKIKLSEIDSELVVKGGKVQVLCDPDAMEQVLTNLIMNAFHHGDPEKKGIRITVTVKKIDRGTLITFEDNGMGIKKENMPELFHPGYTTIEGKTGFGLSIVKKIVEAHNGTICVVCEGPGKGAQFHIILPEE